MTQDAALPHKKFKDLSIVGLPIWVFFISPIMLILAPIEDWPDGYFQALRIITFLTAGAIAFDEYKNNSKNHASVAGLIALLFNPFLTIEFDAETWGIIDFFTASLWIFYLWKKGMRIIHIIFTFALPFALVFLTLASEAIYDFQADIRKRTGKEKALGARLATYTPSKIDVSELAFLNSLVPVAVKKE